MASPGSKAEFIEKVTQQLAEAIELRIALMVNTLGGNSRPPFSVKLSDDEQLEQYFAMTEDKWQELITKYGLAPTVKYSEAMQKLVAKKFGESRMPVIIAPNYAFETQQQDVTVG